jgi:D-alanine-D-alanine ligase
MERKLRVGVVFGGRSGEHEVSLASARSIMAVMDRDKYEIVPIGITALIVAWREGLGLSLHGAEPQGDLREGNAPALPSLETPKGGGS